MRIFFTLFAAILPLLMAFAPDQRVDKFMIPCRDGGIVEL
jgi:hypothetical protein